jgi:hypothetical protein
MITRCFGQAIEVLVAFFSVLTAPVIYAQSPIPFEQDTHAFRFILHNENLEPIRSLGAIRPEATILIFFGDPKSLDKIFHRGLLNDFVRNGGAIFIATDRATDGVLDQDFNIGVDGRAVSAGNSATAYGNSTDCPVVQFRFPGDSLAPKSKLPVATNRPSFLTKEERSGFFAEFPKDSTIGNRQPRSSEMFFGFRSSSGKGKILVLSDHSVFINGMMLQDDTGNFEFAQNCVKWLMAGDSGTKRTKALFVDEGQIRQNFEVAVQHVPNSAISPVYLVNNVIAKMEDDNFFNRLILQRIPIGRIISALAIIVTIAMIVYGFYRLARGSYHLELKVPLAIHGGDQLVSAGAIVNLRHRSLIKTNNFWEAARELARDCFFGLGPESQRTALAGELRTPIFAVQGGWFQRRRWQRRMQSLWRLAHESRPQRISRRQFVQLVLKVEEIKSAVQDGTLSITGRGDFA